MYSFAAGQDPGFSFFLKTIVSQDFTRQWDAPITHFKTGPEDNMFLSGFTPYSPYHNRHLVLPLSMNLLPIKAPRFVG